MHFDDDDIMLDEDVRINNIDIVPNVFGSGDEVSFWMDTRYDIYLLILRDDRRCSVKIYPSGKSCPLVCAVAEMPLEGKGFDSEMKNKLRDLLLEVRYPRIPNQSLHEYII